MSKIKPLGQLDSYIIDELDVGSWDVNSQVEVQTLDILEDITAVCILDHWEIGSAQFLSETVKSCSDISMGLQVDPFCNIFDFGDLTDYELLAEVLVVHHVRRVADHMLDLFK